MGGNISIEEEKQWRLLEQTFHNEIFGQHIAHEMVLKLLKNHCSLSSAPSAALVLSFHGSVGVGKTHTTQIIETKAFSSSFANPTSAAHTLAFSESYGHEFIKRFVGGRDFNDINKLRIYKEEIVKTIESTVKFYGRGVFIFDEVDKMPTAFLNVLTSFMGPQSSHRAWWNILGVNRVDYHKCVFIFLSNTGGMAIDNIIFSKDIPRETLVHEDFKKAIQRAANEESGGLKGSHILRKGLVTCFIPFLPLAKKHMTECVSVELNKPKYTGVVAYRSDIAETFLYYPEKNPMFSRDGAKNVISRVTEQLAYLRLTNN